jgi:hypothetical protein
MDKKATLSYDQIKALVKENNLGTQTITDEVAIAICYLESRFDPYADPGPGAAKGLMGLTRTAMKEIGYDPDDVFDPETNIQAGTEYLQTRIYKSGVIAGLNRYGDPTYPNYAGTILKAANPLILNTNQDPMQILRGIIGK